MKLTLRQIHHQPSTTFTALVERHLDRLRERLAIDEARVVVERRLEASPAFHVSVHLVTPGPDVFAERCEHTLRAALEKTVEDLDAKIGLRTEKRSRRLRADRQAASVRRHPPSVKAN